MQTCYINIDETELNQPDLSRVAEIVRSGGLAAFPTETVYGLGASACNRQAVLRLYEVKMRPRSQPFLLHISSLAQLEGIVQLSEDALQLAKNFWPGPLSIIVPGARGVAEEMLDSEGNIGLRFPSHPVSMALIDLTGPLAATSANLHGSESPSSSRQVQAELDGLIEAVVASDPGVAGMESTILDLCVKPYRIIRLGEVAREEIERVLPGKLARKG